MSIENVLENLGRHCRNKRIQACLTQTAIAESAEVTQADISDFELGKANPSLVKTVRILRAYPGCNGQYNVLLRKFEEAIALQIEPPPSVMSTKATFDEVKEELKKCQATSNYPKAAILIGFLDTLAQTAAQKAKVLLARGCLLKDTGHSESALQVLTRALDAVTALGDAAAIDEVMVNLADLYIRLEMPALADNLADAIILRQAGDKWKFSLAHHVKGMAAKLRNDMAGSISHFDTAIRTYGDTDQNWPDLINIERLHAHAQLNDKRLARIRQIAQLVRKYDSKLFNDAEIRAIGALRLFQLTGQSRWAVLAERSAVEGKLYHILEQLEYHMKNLKSKSAKRTNKMVAAAISATVTVLCLIVLGAAMFTENAVAKSKMDNVIVYSRGAEPGQLVQ